MEKIEVKKKLNKIDYDELRLSLIGMVTTTTTKLSTVMARVNLDYIKQRVKKTSLLERDDVMALKRLAYTCCMICI